MDHMVTHTVLDDFRVFYFSSARLFSLEFKYPFFFPRNQKPSLGEKIFIFLYYPQLLINKHTES